MAQKIIDLAAPTLPLVGTELMEMSEGGTLSVQVAVNEALTKLYYNTVEKAAATVTGISVAEYIDSDTGVLRTSGDLSIEGDLFVDGTTWVVHNQEVTTSDNLIVINYGETGPGVTAGWAGIEVDRGTLTNYQFLFYEDTDTFRIGEIGNLQAVATREDSPIDGGIAFWNDTLKRFDTTTNTSSSVVHNEATGLQGGDSTADEFYHISADIYNGLFSGSPIIGLGTLAGSSVQIDYSSPTNPVELYHNGVNVFKTEESGFRVPDTSIGLTGSDFRVITNQTGSVELHAVSESSFIEFNGVATGGSPNIMARFDPDGGCALNYIGSLRFASYLNGAYVQATSGKLYLNGGSAGVYQFLTDGQGVTTAFWGTQTGGGSIQLANFDPDGSADLYHAGSKVFETDTTGVVVLGDLKVELGSTINEFSTDGTLSDNSDIAVPTEKAVKTYVDNAIGSLEAGNESLSNGDTTAEIIFSQTQSDTNYSQFWSIENSVDSPPSIFTGVVYDKTVNGFKVLFSGTIDSNNYVLSWGII